MSASRDRQVKHAAALGAAAARLQQRTEVLQGLMTEFGALGTSAGALNGSVQALAVRREKGESQSLVPDLDLLHERMGEIADAAKALVDKSAKVEFEDIGERAESLRQQLLAARNKVALLRKGLAASA